MSNTTEHSQTVSERKYRGMKIGFWGAAAIGGLILPFLVYSEQSILVGQLEGGHQLLMLLIGIVVYVACIVVPLILGTKAGFDAAIKRTFAVSLVALFSVAASGPFNEPSTSMIQVIGMWLLLIISPWLVLSLFIDAIEERWSRRKSAQNSTD